MQLVRAVWWPVCFVFLLSVCGMVFNAVYGISCRTGDNARESVDAQGQLCQ